MVNAQSHIVIRHSIERHILVTQNRGTAKSSILIGMSNLNQFLGFPFMETSMYGTAKKNPNGHRKSTSQHDTATSVVVIFGYGGSRKLE